MAKQLQYFRTLRPNRIELSTGTITNTNKSTNAGSGMYVSGRQPPPSPYTVAAEATNNEAVQTAEATNKEAVQATEATNNDYNSAHFAEGVPNFTFFLRR